MKFPRNTRPLRNAFDFAPFAAVFFLFVIFLMIAALLPTPGIPLQLPVVSGVAGVDLPGAGQPGVSVAIDANGRYYFANQVVSEAQLAAKLTAAAQKSSKPLTLVIHADKTVTYEQLVRITLLARDAKITNSLLATLPRVGNMPRLP